MYKLADFGVAQMLDDEPTPVLRSTEGTYHFLAPECTTGDPYDPFQVDIWALGVTLYAMLQGTLPFGTKAASLTQVMDSIRDDPLVFEPGVECDCVDLMRVMLEKDPSKRIRIRELKHHPWIVDGTDDARFSRASSVVVEVSQQEIEAAFTPVNNFILMTKLKMKMSSRLARVRKSVELRHAVDLLSATSLGCVTPSETSPTRVGSSPTRLFLPEMPTESDSHHGESAAPLSTSVVHSRRKSTLRMRSGLAELDALVHAPCIATVPPVVSAASDTEHDVDRDQLHASADAGLPQFGDACGGVRLAAESTSTISPTYLARRPSAIAAAGALPAIDARLLRLDLSLTPVSSPSQSPVASPTNNERDSGVDTLDTRSRRRSSSHRTSPERRRSSIAEEPSVALPNDHSLSLESASNSAPGSPSSSSPTLETERLVPRKSGQLSPPSSAVEAYVQALAFAKPKGALTQRDHNNNTSSSSHSGRGAVNTSALQGGDLSPSRVESWQKESDPPRAHAAAPFLPSPRSQPRTLSKGSADFLTAASEDSSDVTTGATNHVVVLPDTELASDSTLELTQRRSPPMSAKVFEKRKSSITIAGSDSYDTSNAFPKAMMGSGSNIDASSPPRHNDHLSAVGDADDRCWSGPSVQHLDDGISVSVSPADRPRRSSYVRVLSKRRVLLEAQDSLQQMLRRKDSIKFPIARDSEAYGSMCDDFAASAAPTTRSSDPQHATTAVARMGTTISHATKRPSRRKVSAASTLARASSSNVVDESPKVAAATLRPQKTVVCSVM